MLRILRSNHPLVLVLLPIIVAAYSLRIAFSAQTSERFTNSGYAFHYLSDNTLGGNFAILTAIILTVLLSGIVFMLIALVNESNILEKRNFTVGFLFLAIVGLSPMTAAFLPALVALVMFMRALALSLDALREKESVDEFFNIGFILSVASLFYFNIIFFAILFFIAKLIFRRQSIREWLSITVGLILPYILLTLCEFIFLGEVSFYKTFVFDTENLTWQTVNVTSMVGYAILLIVSGFASAAMLSRFYRMNILTRDYTKFFVSETLVALTIFFLINSAGLEILLFAALSIAIPLSDFFNTQKLSKLKSFLFFILIVLIVFVQADIKPAELYNFQDLFSKISF